MVRSRNWPDLWWQISKIRDIQVVGIYDLMKRWRFETNRISSVATAQPQSQKPVLTLTWPGDLTFGDLGLKILHKVSNSIVSRYWKNGGAARRRFSAIREKPEGWAFFAPPPPVRVLTPFSPNSQISISQRALNLRVIKWGYWTERGTYSGGPRRRGAGRAGERRRWGERLELNAELGVSFHSCRMLCAVSVSPIVYPPSTACS